MSKAKEHLDKIMLELRRGTITIGVLSQLKEPQYGYSLVKVLEEKGVNVEPGTLYPLLRRLEKQGLLVSKWDTDETRPRKYYLLSPLGEEVFDLVCKEWKEMTEVMEKLISPRGDGGKTDGFD